MGEDHPWSHVLEEWEVAWVKPRAKLEPDEPPSHAPFSSPGAIHFNCSCGRMCPRSR